MMGGANETVVMTGEADGGEAGDIMLTRFLSLATLAEANEISSA
jgi:hypothetical protein